MSPFSVALRQLRAEHELAQGEFAERLGFRQAYISQLERGSKLPRDSDLVRKIVKELCLPPNQETSLWRAFEVSKRFDFPPPDAAATVPAAAYRYFAKLQAFLPRLSSADFDALSANLDSITESRQLGMEDSRSEREQETPM
jgi:transcriptional regulator with XRE-family HTH domain